MRSGSYSARRPPRARLGFSEALDVDLEDGHRSRLIQRAEAQVQVYLDLTASSSSAWTVGGERKRMPL